MDETIEPLRWGILSTARINQKVLRGAALSGLADVRAVASRSPERAAAFAAQWDIPTSHGSYDGLLADESIEAVYIPLPNGLHHRWTMRALEAGKHVLCEKPYSRRPTEVTEAFDLADRHGLVLSEAYMYRYNPQTRRLCELIAEGAIGEVQVINASFTWPTKPQGDIRLDPDLDGGSLLDVGCYCVSAARLLAGEPTSVSAMWVIGPTGVEVRLVGSMRFEGDVLASFDSGFHLPDRSLLEVVGTLGSVRVRDPWHCLDPGLEIRLLGAPQGQMATIEVIGPENSYQLELEHFARAVRGEPSEVLGRGDAFGQATTIDALYRSATAGEFVRPT